MRYLFSEWDKLRAQLSKSFLFILLDYDGTLTPIAETPQKAVISQATKDLLSKLAKSPHCAAAIISGRSLSNIKSVIGLKDIIYVGNHGLEIEGPKIKFESQVSMKLKSVLRQICADALNKLSKIKGVLIEDKGLSISVHYRLVAQKDTPLFKKIFSEISEPYLAQNKIKVSFGKKVYEIRPPVKWDKGKVALWLLARQQFLRGEDNILPVYIGDDVTDEDAFRALKNKGLTVFVGEPGNTFANYYLKDVDEVAEFLRKICLKGQ